MPQNTVVGPFPSLPKRDRPRFQVTRCIKKGQSLGPPSPFQLSAWPLPGSQRVPFPLSRLKRTFLPPRPRSPSFLGSKQKWDRVGGKQCFLP